MLRFSPAAFLVAYCAAYLLVLAMDLPMFRYYPLHGEFSWGKQVVPGIGPAMAWYGLMANAAAFAVVCALLVPQRWIERVFRGYVWLLPLIAMLGCAYLMRRFFA